MVAILLVTTVLRGSGVEPSVIGVTRCQAGDWGLLGVLILGGLLMTLLAVFMLRREYSYKKSIGFTFVTGDLKCTTRNAVKLPVAALITGFVSALSGLGAGISLQAVLLGLQVPPRVSNETAQVIGTYIGVSATVAVLIDNAIALDYAFVFMSMVILGALAGMKIQVDIMQRTGGKTQYLVLVMVVCMGLILLSTSTMAV